MILTEEDIDNPESACPFKERDKVTYDHGNKVGFSGKVEDVQCVWILTVRHSSGSTLVAPASHWKPIEPEEEK